MGSKQERLKDSNSWLPLFIWPARDARIQYSCQFRTSPKLYLTPASKYQHFQAVIFGASKPSMAASCGLEDTSSWISKKCWHGKLNTQTVLGWITSCRFLWNAKPLTNAWCPESFAEAQNSIFVFWINSIVQKTRRYSNQDGWARPSNPERELCVDSDYNERYLNTLKFDLIVDHSFHRQKSKYLSHLGLLHKTQTTISSWISEHSNMPKKTQGHQGQCQHHQQPPNVNRS